MGKVILAGIVAGIAIFVWGFVEHLATPLGTVGVKMHSAEHMLLPVIQQTTPSPGLYFFPGMDPSKKMTKDEEAAWTEKYKAGPHGLLIVGKPGREPVPPLRLGVELFTNIMTGILLAFLLGRLATGLMGFVSGGIIVSVIAWTSISVPYWNWYEFPRMFTLATLVGQGVGGALAGLVIGLFLKAKKA